jgi:DHA3 family macrolide efflux protein-like MFS transporter
MEQGKKLRLFTKNFFLLWQGQLVSSIGDVMYSLALGFWVLQKTGSTAIMGLLMAVSALPQLILGPIAGVIVDRADRKWIIVTMDIVRGVFVVAVAVLAITGNLEVWMVFLTGVVKGICASVFNPTVSASLPDMVQSANLQRANAALMVSTNGVNIFSNSISGVLFSIVGAPVLFLINGIAYLFSSVTEMFLKIPRVRSEKMRESEGRGHFFDDFMDGLRFVFGIKPLMGLAGIVVLLNFFLNIAAVLVLPYFEWAPDMGAGNYGIFMGAMALGGMLGYGLLSIWKVPRAIFAKYFGVIGVLSCLPFSLMVFLPFGAMLPVAVLGMFLNAAINTMANSTLQAAVPSHMRGKFFALALAMTSGLTPIAMAVGGVLGDLFPIKWVICCCMGLAALMFFVGGFMPGIKKLFLLDPKTQTVEDL